MRSLLLLLQNFADYDQGKGSCVCVCIVYTYRAKLGRRLLHLVVCKFTQAIRSIPIYHFTDLLPTQSPFVLLIVSLSKMCSSVIFKRRFLLSNPPDIHFAFAGEVSCSPSNMCLSCGRPQKISRFLIIVALQIVFRVRLCGGYDSFAATQYF